MWKELIDFMFGIFWFGILLWGRDVVYYGTYS